MPLIPKFGISATASRRICWKTEPTSASSRFCSATPICRRRRATPGRRPYDRRRPARSTGCRWRSRRREALGGAMASAGTTSADRNRSRGHLPPPWRGLLRERRRPSRPHRAARHGGDRAAGRRRSAAMSSAARTAAQLRIAYNSCLMGKSSNGELACRHRHFLVNCSALCLHNRAVLRLRRLGHRWPITNGDEHVGDLLLGIEAAGASAERAKRTIP